MNIHAPVSSVMTTKVFTVGPEDKLQEAYDLFENNRIRHLPVIAEKGEVIGIISKTDLLYFLKGKSYGKHEEHLSKIRLKNYTVKEIMTTGLASLSSKDLIRTALGLFKLNFFHAIPIIDDGQLRGIISSHDIIVSLANQKAITA